MSRRIRKVVKVQRPLFGGDSLLVYCEQRDLFQQVPVDSDLGRTLLRCLGRDLKAYFWCSGPPRDLKIEVPRRAPEQTW